MKFVSLGRERTHRQTKSTEPSRAIPQSFINPVALPRQIHTYTELRHQIHADLRIQHPQWLLPTGESTMCDSYEARLMELLDASTRRRSRQPLQHGLHRPDTASIYSVGQPQN